MKNAGPILIMAVFVVLVGFFVYGAIGDDLANLKNPLTAGNNNTNQSSEDDNKKNSSTTDTMSTSTRYGLSTSTRYNDNNNFDGEYSLEYGADATDIKIEDRSPYFGMVGIRESTARQTNPDREYIILINDTRDKTIPITGWTLKNGKDKKLIMMSTNSTALGTSDIVTIPTGALIPNTLGYDPQVNITLGPKEKVIITTGEYSKNIFITGNFRTNICLGYLNKQDVFYPSLRMMCPSPKSFGGITNLEKSCYDYVTSLKSCHTAEVDQGEYLMTLTSACRSYIRERFNYNGCIKQFRNSADFFGDEWRVFLNRKTELWDETREIITLMDSKGKIVNRVIY